MNITLRTARSQDTQHITRLSIQLDYNITAEQTARLIETINASPNDIIRVAVDGDIIIGWIQVIFTTRLECGSYCEITGLVVDDKYRGKGIGKLLIEDVKPWCIERGCARIVVRSNVKRAAAHKFYLQAGFSEVKEQKIFEATI